MKRLRLVFVTLALSAAGCGGVKTGGSPGSADAGVDGDHRSDGGGPDDDGTDAGGSGSSSCVLGTSELGNCNL